MASEKYLSFNANSADAVNLDDLPPSSEKLDTSKPLPLRYTWKLWEQIESSGSARAAHQYSNNTKELTAFSTVQEFWEIWHQLPQPSDLLSEKRMMRKEKDGPQQEVDALMIFKDGISPMWEDPVNKVGYHMEFRLPPNSFNKGQVDEYWNNIVLALIGDNLPSGKLITGVRMVDKLSIPHNPALRIEVWFTACSDEESKALCDQVTGCMTKKLNGTSGRCPRFDVKRHF